MTEVSTDSDTLGRAAHTAAQQHQLEAGIPDHLWVPLTGSHHNFCYHHDCAVPESKHSSDIAPWEALPEDRRAFWRAVGEGVAGEKLYVPGEWICPKCAFTLQKNFLYAMTGAVGTNNENVREVCPNDGVTLVRQTWEEQARIAIRIALDHATRAEALESELTALLSEADAWGWEGDNMGNFLPRRWADRLRAALGRTGEEQGA